MTLPDKLLNKKMINTTHEMWVNEKIPLQWTMPLETTNLEQAQELITEIIKRYNNYIELETKALLWDEHDIAYCTKKSQYKLLEQENKELKRLMQVNADIVKSMEENRLEVQSKGLLREKRILEHNLDECSIRLLQKEHQYNKLRDALKEKTVEWKNRMKSSPLEGTNPYMFYLELQSILDSVESEK